jgi:hypothetical protein
MKGVPEQALVGPAKISPYPHPNHHPRGTRRGAVGRVYSDYQVCRKAPNAPVALSV